MIGLQMLGVINLPFDRLNRCLPIKRPERRGFVGALLFGMLFGLVASPVLDAHPRGHRDDRCHARPVPQGALLLFVYGFGKGVPLMLLGLAAGSLTVMRSLSRATGALTKIGGVALIGAAAYLVWIA